MKRKIFAGLLAVCMLLCMLPVVSLAADDAVMIDGDVIADGATVNGASLSGNTLTLNGVNADFIYLPASVTNLVLTGNNALTQEDGDIAIQAAGDLTVSGAGTLTISGGYDNGIYAAGKITVDGATISIDGAETGIYSAKSGVQSNVTVPTPTFMYDFTKPTGKLLGDGSTDLGVAGVGTTKINGDLSKGYLDTTCTGGDPYIWMNTNPSDAGIKGKDMAYMVIKYANSAPLIDQTQVMYSGGDAGMGWGPTGATWRWATNDGSWDVMTVWDGKDITSGGETFTSSVTWANSETGIKDFRLDYWSAGIVGSTWGDFKLAYIAFFATQADAEAYAAAEEKKIEIDAASGISANKVFTENGTTYTADTVISLTKNSENTLNNAPSVIGSFQTCYDAVILDGVYQCDGEAHKWMANQGNKVDVSGKSTLGLYGWFGEGSRVTKVGYQIGAQQYWTVANPSASNAAANGTTVKSNPIFYDQSLVDALGGKTTARRFYIEIDLSNVPTGSNQVGFLVELDGTTTYRVPSGWPEYISLLKNNSYDYTDGTNNYIVNGTDIYLNGADTGLDLVTSGSSYWAVGGVKVPVTKNANGTYSHADYSESGYYMGTPYTVTVKDKNGANVVGATVKMYNAQGNVVARATSSAAGVATVYAPSYTGSYKFSVEGEGFTAKTNLTATNYALTVKVDAAVVGITAIVLKNGANVTINAGDMAIATNSGSEKLEVTDSILNADTSAIDADFDATVSITGASVTVGKNFALNVYVNAAWNGSKVVVNGKAYAITAKNGELVATIDGIAPQAIADSMSISVVDNNGAAQATKTYSVKDNLVNLYNNASSSAALKTLIADLLKYAAAAQNYTGYKAGSIDASGYVGSGATASTADNKFNLSTTTAAGYNFTGATVFYDNTNKLFVGVRAADYANVTVKVNGESATIADAGNDCYGVYTDAIFANEFADTFTFELLVNGIVVQTLEYSVNTYAYRMGDAGNANAALAQALYCYGVSAANYVA